MTNPFQTVVIRVLGWIRIVSRLRQLAELCNMTSKTQDKGIFSSCHISDCINLQVNVVVFLITVPRILIAVMNVKSVSVFYYVCPIGICPFSNMNV